MDLSPGTTVCGRFELLREESSNSGVPVFGPTWAVLDTQSGEPARACVLDAALLPDAAARAAFVRAVSALGDLRDGSLVPQVFVGEDGARVIVCYDPLQGAFALGDLYDGTGPLDLRQEAGRLARQLARALSLLHGRDQLHGMLAGEAVFVGPRGPAVFQHGFAPLCARAELERRCQAFHLATLAPEVARGGAFSPASDVYAWGVALAQFVTGQRGPAAFSAAEPTGLPTGLWSLIQMSLSHEPGSRPQGGADLVRRLEGLAVGTDTLELPVVSPAAAAPVPEALSEAPAVSPTEAATATTGEAKPADVRAPIGKSLPMANLEDLLLTSPRRPTTVPPGSLTAADVDGKVPGRSASGMRRVHVLTEDAIVRRPPTAEVTPPAAPGDVIVGGTKAEMEAASRAPTVRLEPPVTGEPLKAAGEEPEAARPSQERTGEPPRGASSSPPTLEEPRQGSGGGLLWLAIAAVVVLVLAWLLG